MVKTITFNWWTIPRLDMVSCLNIKQLFLSKVYGQARLALYLDTIYLSKFLETPNVGILKSICPKKHWGRRKFWENLLSSIFVSKIRKKRYYRSVSNPNKLFYARTIGPILFILFLPAPEDNGNDKDVLLLFWILAKVFFFFLLLKRFFPMLIGWVLHHF